jgi:hypothetical protein
MKVSVGQVIRGYDFKPMVGREDCYVEGEVLELNAIDKCGYNAYRIRVTKDVFDGKEFKEVCNGCRVGKTVFVPWRVSFMEFQGRVMNLSE